MRRNWIPLAACGAILLGAGVLAQQEAFPTPRAGTGVVTVTGTVDVGNMPDVGARQSGGWVVDINRIPPVEIAGTAFLRSGARYAVTWADGTSESVTVLDPGAGGWVPVQTPGRPRWVNFAAARSIEELR